MISVKYKFPKNSPKSAKDILVEVLSSLHQILHDSLTGIYLYGSLAMDCFQPGASDIDVIIVTKKKLSKEHSRRIIDYLKRNCSKEKRIELSIICADALQNPSYPLMVDLHYEHWDNTFENKKDSEILSNLYTTKERGFCVWGTPTEDAFSEIPADYHLRSVIEDLQHTRKHLHDDPQRVGYDAAVYWILGSCRILAFIRQEKVLSKLEGGQWGLTNLPKTYDNLVRQALSSYQRKNKNRIWNPTELDAFADYMTQTISRESKLVEQKSSV